MSLNTAIFSSPALRRSRISRVKCVCMGVVAVAAIFAFVGDAVAGVAAHPPGDPLPPPVAAAYGGLGAKLASFSAANLHGIGTPPAGQTYYQVDDSLNGRVSAYHVLVGSTLQLGASAFLARLTKDGKLPSDARLVKPYNGTCAVYRSRWLGKVTFGLPHRVGGGKGSRFGYAIVYVNRNSPSSNGVNVSLAPDCRG